MGDRCVSFHFTPDYWEAVIAAVPGVRMATFPIPHLPPLSSLIPHIATIETACGDRVQPPLSSRDGRQPKCFPQAIGL
jgi:hypothetical protein